MCDNTDGIAGVRVNLESEVLVCGLADRDASVAVFCNSKRVGEFRNSCKLGLLNFLPRISLDRDAIILLRRIGMIFWERTTAVNENLPI